MSVTLDCAKLTTREINSTIKRLAAEGETEIQLINPEARHSLGVAIFYPVKIVVEGTAGYFCGGMNDGATFHILGNTGWSVGECMLSGEIVVERNAASGSGASIRGGTVVVKGHVGGRTGISQKGGLIVVGGNTDRKSTRLNSSHQIISYAVFCFKKKKHHRQSGAESEPKKTQSEPNRQKI